MGCIYSIFLQIERILHGTESLRPTGLRGARIVSAGEQVAIRPGRPHTFHVVRDGARFVAEFRPAWRIAEVFRDVFSFSAERRLGRFGFPRLSDVAGRIEEHPEDFFYAAVVPVAVQRSLATVVRKAR